MNLVSVVLSVLIMIYSFFGAAADAPSEQNSQSSEQVQTISDSREFRNNSTRFINAIYSPVDLLVPSKYGFNLGYVKSADTTWEFEFLRGTIDSLQRN